MNIPPVDQLNALTALIGAITAAITGIGGFIFGHRRGMKKGINFTKDADAAASSPAPIEEPEEKK